jgi:hypothetical protein
MKCPNCSNSEDQNLIDKHLSRKLNVFECKKCETHYASISLVNRDEINGDILERKIQNLSVIGAAYGYGWADDIIVIYSLRDIKKGGYPLETPHYSGL